MVGPAKLVKTPDQISCIRKACRITEEAMVDVQKALAPGVRQIDLSAAFVRRAFELGATANMLEAIWQVMPTTKTSGGVWTTTGDLALPLLTTERELVRGRRAVDRRQHHLQRATARTSAAPGWWATSRPTDSTRSIAKWREILDAVLAVTKAGATSGDLARAAIAANGGKKPWLPHFYLGHGIGTNAAEMPMIGTDLGEEFDDNFVFPAGMVLVLEPVIWEDGTGGYRSEEIVVITEDGYHVASPTTPTHPTGGPDGTRDPARPEGSAQRPARAGRWPRWRPTTSTSWSSAARPTSDT